MKARIALLPGDGIGPEVIAQARRVLEAVASRHGHGFEFAEARIGGSLSVVRRAARFRPALERAGTALERVGLADRAAAPAGLLSHGDKRKLEIAMLLAGEPQVVLLDEPMAGVSVEDVDGLVEVIRTVHEEEGRTVLLVEHRMEVVVGLAERLAVMHHGALLAFDTPTRVMADDTVQSAYLGEPL